jgi:hypothetical protein
VKQEHLDRFYEVLLHLKTVPGQGTPLRELSGRSNWPSRGVYFFREPGETRRDGSERIVRVGTHAVSAHAKSKLWGRLRAHRGGRDGGGNHRGSIFRLHVGVALLVRGGDSLPSWSVGHSAGREVRDKETIHERLVSAHIGSMSVLWVDVGDEPGPLSARARLERNAIALLSNSMDPMDPPSEGWLGLNSPREEIRNSGLWNLNYVRDQYDPTFLDDLEGIVLNMK